MWAAFGWSWEELRWWVEHQAAQTSRIFLRVLWATAPTGPEGMPEVAATQNASQIESWLAGAVHFVADY